MKRASWITSDEQLHGPIKGKDGTSGLVVNRLLHRALACAWLSGIAWLCPAGAGAGTFGLSGYTAGEIRLFFESAALPEQSDEPQLSCVLTPEFHYRSDDRAHQIRLIPFMRLDSIDANRTHADLREGYWRCARDSWRVLVGVNRIFWGVAESRHLVDIINQTDSVEDIDQEEKLGQPMVLYGSQQAWGDVQLFLMPYFRERTFPSPSGRLRTDPPVSDTAIYESAAAQWHVDAAVRYAHHAGGWDIGGSYFYGTSREPVLFPSETESRLVPVYEVIHQIGADVQYTRDAWLWKFEGIVRDGDDDRFTAMVGGFEYTRYQAWNSPADLGCLFEYTYDGRELFRAPPTVYDNDVYIGLRLSLNDEQTTEALLGALVDLDTAATFVSLEARRRVGDAWTVVLDGRFFANLNEDTFAESFARDSFINIGLRRYF